MEGRGKTMERRGWEWTLRGPSGLGVSTLWGSFTLLVTSGIPDPGKRGRQAPGGGLRAIWAENPGGSQVAQCQRLRLPVQEILETQV